MIDTYSIQDETLVAIGDAIRKKTNTTELLTPIEMAEVIETIPDPVSIDPIVLTGNCSNAGAGAIAGAYIKNFGNTISTNNITNADRMFNSSTLEEIPFDLNFDANYTQVLLGAMFQGSRQLKSIGAIRNLNIGDASYMFNGCYNLRYLPEFIDCGAKETTSAYTNRIQFASDCMSLREVSGDVLKLFNNKLCNSSYYSLFYNGFWGCYSLDELVDVPVPTASGITSNLFYNTVNDCSRLKNFIFEMNEDGTPISVSWKNQTVNLSSMVGYGNSTSKQRILQYNSGITADKEVKDANTYTALKDDPDWFTCDINYSRFNHDSAVRTINSLPDASSGSGNVVKFKGSGGALTDGGAANTLTEEEIAVATARGWTISFA